MVRIGFGLALAFVGIAHYQDLQYAESVGRGLGILEPVGMIWGYILPGLMIIGGLLLAFGIYMRVAAVTAGLALSSILAGLMLKSAMGVALSDTMPLAIDTLVWMLVFLLVTKTACGPMCGGECSTGCGCGPGCDCGGACDCGDDHGKTAMAKPVIKSAPAAPAVVRTVPAKKPAVKVVPKRVPPKRKA